MTIADEVRAIIADELVAPTSMVTDDAHLRDDLGADSLDQISVMIECETRFQMRPLDDDAATGLLTVGDVIRYVERHRGEL